MFVLFSDLKFRLPKVNQLFHDSEQLCSRLLFLLTTHSTFLFVTAVVLKVYVLLMVLAAFVHATSFIALVLQVITYLT